MTYDIAIWKSDRQLSDREASEQFEERVDTSDARYPAVRAPAPEMLRLADLLEQRFPNEPWEDLRGSLDGDFLYLTVGGADAGAEVEAYAASAASGLGLLVYSPLSDSVVRPN